jgi:putative phage-type endonuclease
MMTAEAKAAWLSERCGYLTASRMADAMSFLKNGQPSRERLKLIYEIIAERATGENVRHVVTDAMQHGVEYEDEAVDKFVELTGRDVKLSRFYKHTTIPYFGATPDREIDDGLLEVKCPMTATFLEWKLAGVVPERHKPQMAAQLLCTGKTWCGFVAYDPRIKDERRRLFMAKFEPADEYLREVEDAAKAFLADVERYWEAFTLGTAA